MKKMVGYIVAIVGLAVMGLSFGLFTLDVPYLDSFKPLYVTIGGIVMIILGILLTRGEGHQKSKEVPIYEKGAIVGYRRS